MAESSVADWVMKVNNEARRRGSDVNAEVEQRSKRSIYRIPAAFTDDNRNAYRPKTVSFGPYHHGEDDVKAMEEHKRRALVHFLRRSEKPLEHFLESLAPLVQHLNDAYDSLPPSPWQQDTHAFLSLMVLDGCFMLEILLTAFGSVKDDYAPNDPVFSDHGRLYLIPHLRRDMLLLENQLPMLVLYTLHAGATNMHNGVEFVNNLTVKMLNPSTPKKNSGRCLHVLDLYRKNLLWKSSARRRQAVKKRRRTAIGGEQLIREATELYDAGIRFKKSRTLSLSDISFRSGVLRLPLIVLDDTSESLLRNLIAFERSHVGAGSEVTSYVFFMDCIIDNNKDNVGLLVSSGILQNAMGGEQAVAKLFNSLTKDMSLDPESNLDVMFNAVNDYYYKPWNQLRAYLNHNYFNGPWIPSFIVALFLFALTFIQTLYSVLAYHKDTASV